MERGDDRAAERRGPGRPEIGPAINVRLTDELLARVNAAAKADRRSRAAMIRKLLNDALLARGD